MTTVPDYISVQLTGKAVTDITDTQMTGMFDINMKKWVEKILRWAGCRHAWMSDVLDLPKIFAEGLYISGAVVSLASTVNMRLCGRLVFTQKRISCWESERRGQVGGGDRIWDNLTKKGYK